MKIILGNFNRTYGLRLSLYLFYLKRAEADTKQMTEATKKRIERTFPDKLETFLRMKEAFYEIYKQALEDVLDLLCDEFAGERFYQRVKTKLHLLKSSTHTQDGKDA